MPTLAPGISNGPATFHCVGITGLLAINLAEMPMPPNVSNDGPGGVPAWGAPITVIRNRNHIVSLTTASYTAPDGTVIQLNVLTSANDPAHPVQPNYVVAYPAKPLAAGTMFTVDLSGAMSGRAFTKRFAFTTGS